MLTVVSCFSFAVCCFLLNVCCLLLFSDCCSVCDVRCCFGLCSCWLIVVMWLSRLCVVLLFVVVMIVRCLLNVVCSLLFVDC